MSRFQSLIVYVIVVLLAGLSTVPCNGAVTCSPSTQTSPHAVDDSLEWPSGAVNIPVLHNDYDPDGTPLTIIAVGSAAPAGLVVISSDQKSLMFTPNAGYSQVTFAYTIQDAGGETASANVSIRPSGPTVTFSYTCNRGTDCTFTANPSTFEDLAEYRWRFICPTGAANCTGVTVQGHQWRSRFQQLITPGFWTVGLDVTYYTGKVATVQQSVEIKAFTPFIRFIEAFEPTGAKDDLCIGIEISETNLDSPNEAQYRVYWDLLGAPNEWDGFSNISGILHQKKFHCYTQPGPRRVSAWVQNLQGEIGTYAVDFDLRNGPPEILEFTLVQDTNNPSLVTATIRPFDDASGDANSTSNPPTVTSRQWDLGNGSTAVTTSGNSYIAHYQASGTFDFTVRLTDNFGATVTASKPVTIPNKPPQGYLTLACSGLACTVKANAVDDIGVRSYSWNFAGQTAITQTSSLATAFAAEGRYPIVVTISDGELTTTLKRVAEVRAPKPLEQLAFYTVPPCRAYDSGGTIAAGTTTLASLSSCIPADAAAVELNSVVVSATQNGHLAVWSPNDAIPATTTVNFEAGVNRANNAAVAVANRSVNFRLSTAGGGAARVILDVVGYYAPERAAVAPDTGPFTFGPQLTYSGIFGSISASANTAAIQMGDPGAGAAFFNASVFNSTTGGHLQAYATATAVPTASVLNFQPATVVSNGVIAKLAPGITNGNVTLRYVAQAGANAQYAVDGVGSFGVSTGTNYGYRFETVKPCRLLDTRNADYGYDRLEQYVERAIYAGGNCGVPKFYSEAVRINVIVVNPSADGELFLRGTGNGTEISLLTFKAGKNLGNATAVSLDWFERAGVFFVKSTAATDLIVDVVGYYRIYPALKLNAAGLTVRAEVPGGWPDAWHYQLDYGDSRAGAEQSSPVCRTYDLPGTYPVRMTAWHPAEPVLKIVSDTTVTVSNAVPVAQFTLAQDRKIVSVDATGSRDEPPPQEVPAAGSLTCDFIRTNSELRYQWDYGDGTSGTGITASHTYGMPGTVTLRLTATDRNGAQNTFTRTVVVPNDPPTAKFTFNCAALDCQFDASESTDDGGITGYKWVFGSTSVSGAGPITAYHFPSSGKYTVQLVTADGSLSSPAATAVVNVTTTAATGALSFFPMGPCRLLDTRTGAKLAGGTVTQVGLTAAAGVSTCGIPATATAVAANFVVWEPTGDGHLIAWDGTAPTPAASILNFSLASVPRANNAIVKVDAGGRISILPSIAGTTPATHLLLDVYGYFAADTVAAPGARGPYKFDVTNPCRFYDSRTAAALAAGEIRYVKLDPACNAPASAAAISSNLTIINSTAAGNATLFSSALGAPAVASTINYRPSLNIANGALVELGKRSTDDLGVKYSPSSPSSTAHVLLDATGFFSPQGTLTYKAIAPCRLLDTRLPEYGTGRLSNGVPSAIQVQGNCGIPRGAVAAVLNLVAIAPDGSGNLQAARSDKLLPGTSILNYASGDAAVSNGAVVALAPSLPRDLILLPALFGGGTGVHVVIDAVGYFSADSTAIEVSK